ncbi:MAG: glycosyltransferase family 39 protein [Candidatus Micrarchaeota archaeon]|nr:glycosyltransferase family 39 protein [Candidatus Micrarchaeota archaeon]
MAARRHARSRKIPTTTFRKELLVVAALLFLALAVRLYYFTGPTFANTQDEGIYYNIFLQGVVLHNYPHFTQYLGANFGDPDQGIFNPAVIPTFYSGLIYPEMFLLKTLGFSANLALYYVILTSLVEGLFIYLILKEISGFRTAVISLLLFSFFPLNVMFANRLEPLVPAAMFVTIASYILIRSMKLRNRGEVATAGVLTGIFIGLGYLTNPLSLSLLVFLVLLMASGALRGVERPGWYAYRIALVVAGIGLVFSVSGVFYYMQSGNFLLYPTVDRIAAVNNLINQPVSTLAQIGGIKLVRLDVQPLFYLPIFFNYPSPQPYGSSYFSFLGYISAAAAVGLVLLRVRFARFFAGMLLLYFILINFFPLASHASGGATSVLLVYMEPMLLALLTLPVIALSALGIDYLLSRAEPELVAFGAAILVAAIVMSVVNLNGDVMLPRSSMATVNAMASFVQTVPNATFYLNPYISGEVDVLTAHKYRVLPMTSCSSAYMEGIAQGNSTYIAVGGTANMDVDEQIIHSFSDCEAANLTAGSELVYTANNPYMDEPELQVYRLGAG